MSPQPYIDYLCQSGFVEMPHLEHHNGQIKGMHYFHRAFNGKHEYVSVLTYEGKFCEVVYERFLAPMNTRFPKSKDFKKGKDEHSDWQKRGFKAEFSMLYRSLEDLQKVVLC